MQTKTNFSVICRLLAMQTVRKVLITGATGMLARKLAAKLTADGVETVALSRSSTPIQGFNAVHTWNPDRGILDENALRNVDAIVHLAGAGIADKKWTDARKQEIINSRVKGTELLSLMLHGIPNRVQIVVSASATGYYGDCGASLKTEIDAAGEGFLAETCQKWENALEKLHAPARRTVILRIGFVIDRQDGALPVMARPVRLFAGAPYGSGKQYLSWIDSSDLIRLFIFAIGNEKLSGIYNAVAPTPVINSEFIKTIGRTLHRPVWPIGIPGTVFRILMGEQADLILQSQYASSGKISDTGFVFEYPDLKSSLKHHLA